MTAPDLAPHWGDDADWAGLLLLIVPAAKLPTQVSRLTKLVRERIESDAALYDVVTVACAPSPARFEAPADWHRAVLASLVRGAMPDGHYFAPRGILATMVVGESAADLKWASEQLHNNGPLGWFRSIDFARTVHFDRDLLTPASIRSIAQAASEGIATYERQPDVALDEHAFLAAVDELFRQGVILPEDLPPPRPQAATSSRMQDAAPFRMQAATPSRTQAWPASRPLGAAPPRPHSAAPPRPRAAAPAAPPPAQRVGETAVTEAFDLPVAVPGRAPQAPVFHKGDDMVVVDSRSALGRLRSPAPTDADAVEQIAMSVDAVSLVYFVVVPDEESSGRKAGREHRTLALTLDQLLATVGGDALTGRRMGVAVEVVVALNPLQKHGVLRPAGDLTEGDLPRVPTDLLDHAKTVDALLNAAQRTAGAFKARAVEVLSLHYIFLSSVPLHAANTIGTDWDRLLAHARVTWIEIGPAQPADFDEPLDIAPSPYGFHLVSDRYDVAAMVRDESAGLYLYRPAPVVQEPEPAAPEPAPVGSEMTTKISSSPRRLLGRWRRQAG